MVKQNSTTVTEDRVFDDGIEYNSNAIELVHTPEGRAIPSAGNYNLQYQVTDHLGNIRALFADANNDGMLSSNEILQMTDYYAFGRPISYNTGTTATPDNLYKYNGKELQQDLAEFDYGARFYDPTIARWTAVDPMAEMYNLNTPFGYALNNPIKFIDPNGKIVIGEKEDDARKLHEDIDRVFAGDKFEKFRNIIKQSGKKGDGKAFLRIKDKDVDEAVKGLTGDDLALAKLVAQTINSSDVQTVEYSTSASKLSEDAVNAMNDKMAEVYSSVPGMAMPVFPDSRFGREIEGNGGSANFPTRRGSISIILEGDNIQYSAGKREVNSFHEIFGHGVPSAQKLSNEINNTNAIRVENLTRRVLGITEYRDGHDHSGGVVANPTALPTVKP